MISNSHMCSYQYVLGLVLHLLMCTHGEDTREIWLIITRRVWDFNYLQSFFSKIYFYLFQRVTRREKWKCRKR